MIVAPPAATERLFPDAPGGALGLEAFSPFWIGRLLEEGEEADLRWLTRRQSEESLQAWLEERGGRQLSGRSRAFWRLVLGRDPIPGPAVAEELWSL